MPLEQNPLTGELFLRLPPPHTDIIITPPRPSPETDHHEYDHDHHDGGGGGSDDDDDDETIITTALNDPRVYSFLENPPFPYRRENAVDYVRMVDAECRRILSSPELQRQIQRQLQIQRERQDSDPAQDTREAGQASSFADGCPFQFIRKVVPATSSTSTGKSDDGVKESTKEVIIGDIGLRRYPFYEIPPDRSEERNQAIEKNAALPAGHPDLIWGVGFWLLPTHHGRGIMTSALRTIITDWAIPWMNVSVLKASAFVGNDRSVAVFTKNGFVLEGTVEKGSAVLHEAKGGGRKDIVVLRWARSEVKGRE